jgi:hypothetical protein
MSAPRKANVSKPNNPARSVEEGMREYGVSVVDTILSLIRKNLIEIINCVGTEETIVRR